MVIKSLKRIFGRSHQGPASVSAEQAEVRLKALKGQLARNKSEAKRLFSEVEKSKHMSPEQKAAHRARLKELDREKDGLVKEMKAMQRRLPKK